MEQTITLSDNPNWSLEALGRQGNLFRRRITVVSAADAPLNVNDEIIHSGFMAGITRVAVDNETNDYTRIRIGVVSGKTFHTPHHCHFVGFQVFCLS